MKYELLKDWPSKRHGKTIKKGTFVIIKIESELDQLIELECIEKPQIKEIPIFEGTLDQLEELGKAPKEKKKKKVSKNKEN